jgi:drug/metabolite transporter (DMT)-like permease
MCGIAAFVDRRHGLPSRRQLLQYGAIGFLLLGLGNGLVMWAERSIPSGIAALLVATVPLWMMILDGLRPGGPVGTARAWIGVGVGLVGVFLVARPEGGDWSAHFAGIVALQIATVAWTIGALYSQSIAKKLPVMTATAVEMVIGSLCLLVESRLIGEDFETVRQASSGAWGALAYLVVFGSLVGFTAFSYCLNELPATVVGTYAYVNPVVAVALGALLLGEPLSGGLLVGGVLIVVAVVLSTLARAQAAPSRVEAKPEPALAD